MRVPDYLGLDDIHSNEAKLREPGLRFLLLSHLNSEFIWHLVLNHGDEVK